MADEGFELEDGELVVAASAVNGASSGAAADVQLRAQLREVTQVFRQRGQTSLARLALGLVEANLRDAMWVLDDQVRSGGGEFSGDPALFDEFRRTIRMHLVNLQQAGYEEDVVSEALRPMVLHAAEYAAARLVLTPYFDDIVFGDEPSSGAVPASAAAVRTLEKQTFIRAAAGGEDDDGGVTECSICAEEFVDGGQVAVMPCPSRVHKFHPDCIAKWLAISNVCPLCRHELPSACYE